MINEKDEVFCLLEPLKSCMFAFELNDNVKYKQNHKDYIDWTMKKHFY